MNRSLSTSSSFLDQTLARFAPIPISPSCANASIHVHALPHDLGPAGPIAHQPVLTKRWCLGQVYVVQLRGPTNDIATLSPHHLFPTLHVQLHAPARCPTLAIHMGTACYTPTPCQLVRACPCSHMRQPPTHLPAAFVLVSRAGCSRQCRTHMLSSLTPTTRSPAPMKSRRQCVC